MSLRQRSKYLIAICFLTIANFAYSQENNTVTWSFESKKTAPKEYTIYLTATVKDGWYVYSQYLDSDDGPVKTQIVLDKNEDISLDGKATEEGGKIEGFDELFEMNITKYKKQLVIAQKVKITKSTTVKGVVTFMTCNDEQCLPPSDVKFELKLK